MSLDKSSINLLLLIYFARNRLLIASLRLLPSRNTFMQNKLAMVYTCIHILCLLNVIAGNVEVLLFSPISLKVQTLFSNLCPPLMGINRIRIKIMKVHVYMKS